MNAIAKRALLSLGIALAAICGLTAFKRDVGQSNVPARAIVQGEMPNRPAVGRQTPLILKPVRTMPDAVREEDVVAVLCGALPWWNPPTVPSAFHELKLWGRRAVFSKAMLGIERSGEWLVDSLLNDASCQSNLSGEKGYYLLDSPYGIRIVQMGTEDATRFRGQAHYGQLLKVLGEVGVPAAHPVTTSSGRVGTVEDILSDELMQFAFAGELEFMATAMAYWLPPQKSWRNQFDEEFDFDMVVERLIQQPLGKGSCGGCHVPYAIVVILRVDEVHRVLRTDSRVKAKAWLNDLLRLLERNMAERGAWNSHWTAASGSQYMFGDDLSDRITVTGHHLEWMALLPEHIHPNELLIQRAVQFLRADLESLPPLETRSFKSLLPVSHAARALALIRGVDPFVIWKQYWETGRLKKTPKGFVVTAAT